MDEVLIIPSDEFRRQAKRLAKKYKSLVSDLQVLMQMLTDNPFAGIDLGGGKRKVRMQVGSKGRGKSGGMRVITYSVEKTDNVINVYLITLYDKSEYANVSDRYVDQIIRSL